MHAMRSGRGGDSGSIADNAQTRTLFAMTISMYAEFARSCYRTARTYAKHARSAEFPDVVLYDLVRAIRREISHAHGSVAVLQPLYTFVRTHGRLPQGDAETAIVSREWWQRLFEHYATAERLAMRPDHAAAVARGLFHAMTTGKSLQFALEHGWCDEPSADATDDSDAFIVDDDDDDEENHEETQAVAEHRTAGALVSADMRTAWNEALAAALLTMTGHSANSVPDLMRRVERNRTSAAQRREESALAVANVHDRAGVGEREPTDNVEDLDAAEEFERDGSDDPDYRSVLKRGQCRCAVCASVDEACSAWSEWSPGDDVQRSLAEFAAHFEENVFEFVDEIMRDDDELDESGEEDESEEVYESEEVDESEEIDDGDDE